MFALENLFLFLSVLSVVYLFILIIRMQAIRKQYPKALGLTLRVVVYSSFLFSITTVGVLFFYTYLQ